VIPWPYFNSAIAKTRIAEPALWPCKGRPEHQPGCPEFLQVACLVMNIIRARFHRGYCLRTTGGPLVRFATRSTVTSTRSAILTSGIPLFIP
jgi:hypothetical protein